MTTLDDLRKMMMLEPVIGKKAVEAEMNQAINQAMQSNLQDHIDAMACAIHSHFGDGGNNAIGASSNNVSKGWFGDPPNWGNSGIWSGNGTSVVPKHTPIAYTGHGMPYKMNIPAGHGDTYTDTESGRVWRFSMGVWELWNPVDPGYPIQPYEHYEEPKFKPYEPKQIPQSALDEFLKKLEDLNPVTSPATPAPAPPAAAPPAVKPPQVESPDRKPRKFDLQ